MQAKNFCSTLETETSLTPHKAYIALGIDAALLQFNDDLPNMTDDENQRLIEAAHVAAATALQLAQVPDQWLDFMEAMRADYRNQVRQELWEIVFEQLPDDKARVCGDEKVAALEKLRRMVGESRKKALFDAVMELDEAYMTHLLYEVEEAFALGFEVASNPAKLLLEKAGK